VRKKRIIGQRARVNLSLAPMTIARLNDIAKANNRTLAEEARAGVEFYLENFERLKSVEWQTPIEWRLGKLENRFAALIAKDARASAQALYFIMLPYTKGGLPNKPLPKEAVHMLWEQSRAFAADWLKKKANDEQGANEGSADQKGASDG
jgi:hypothetical protein